MIGFLVFLLFLYLFFQSILSLLFYIYLWQVKEYRTDRLSWYLKTKTGKKQVIDYLNIFKWKGVPRPVFTLKAFLIFFFSLFLLFRAWFFFLKYLPFDFSLRILIASCLVNIFAPFLSSLGVFLFKPVTLFFKKLIIFLAKRKISFSPNLLVVGITGSFGKSSTKEFLATILAEKFKVLKTPKNWNTEIGVAKTVLRSLKKEHQIFVVEMAAYKNGEIKAICEIGRPKIGILTGINEQHLALFGSLTNTMKAKYELIESLPEDGLAVFNGDNSYCRKLARKTKIKKRVYSLKEVKNIKVGKKRISFEVGEHQFQLNLLGAQNIGNFLAAFSVAKELSLSLKQISKAADKIGPFEGTMKPFLGIKGAFFIDDTYSCNPEGFMAALSYLENRRGRKIVITPGMIELGRASAKIHGQIGKKMASICDLVIISKRDFAEHIKKGGANVIVEEDPRRILQILKREVKKGDIVLLEGRLPKIIMKNVK